MTRQSVALSVAISLAGLASVGVGEERVVPVEAVQPPYEGPHSADEIRAALSAWRKSFRSVRIKIEWTWTGGAVAPELIGRVNTYESIWGESRRQRYVRQFSWYRDFNTGELDGMLRVSGSDEARDFEVTYRPGERDVSRPLQVMLTTPGDSRGEDIAPAALVWAGGWLAEIFEIGRSGVPDGYAVIDGIAHPRVRVGTEAQPAYYAELLLDPAHGFVPWRRRSGAELVKVTDFREVAPGVWWPAAGTWRTTQLEPSENREGAGLTWQETVTEQEWRVTEITLDPKLTTKTFEPPIGPGTEVIDRTDKPYMHATPQDPVGLWGAAAVIGGGLAVLAVLLARRRASGK